MAVSIAGTVGKERAATAGRREAEPDTSKPSLTKLLNWPDLPATLLASRDAIFVLVVGE